MDMGGAGRRGRRHLPLNQAADGARFVAQWLDCIQDGPVMAPAQVKHGPSGPPLP